MTTSNLPIDTFRFVGIQEDAIGDFPPYISWVLYAPNCPYRCPFCFNKKIVEGTTGEEYSIKEILDKIQEENKDKTLIDAIVLSGGEPLLHKNALIPFSQLIKSMGLKIKLDTTLIGSEIRDWFDVIDGVSFSLKAKDFRFKSKITQIQAINFNNNLELKEVRVILTKDNVYDMKRSWEELINLGNAIFTPKFWRLHIGRAIKVPKEDRFGDFEEFTPEEFLEVAKDWPHKNEFRKFHVVEK